jgi:heat shock protein HslJ
MSDDRTQLGADEQMDVRLRGAGERWRAATALDQQTETVDIRRAVSVDHEETAVGRGSNRRWWWAATSAAAVAAVVIGVVATVGLGRDNHTSAAGGPSASPSKSSGHHPAPGPSGPGPAPGAHATPLIGTTWALVWNTTPNHPIPTPTTAAPVAGTLLFPDARHAVLNIGCGGSVAPVSLTWPKVQSVATFGTMTVGQFRFLAGLCDVPAPIDPNLITAVVSGQLQWSITGGTLTLTKPGAGRLAFHAELGPDQISILGRTWHITTFTQNGKTYDAPQSATLRIALGQHGRNAQLTATASCDTLHADIVIRAGTLTLSHLDWTRYPCPFSGQLAQDEENAIINTLVGTVTSELNQHVALVLTHRGVQLTYQLSRPPSGSASASAGG